jgi:phosphatidylglycerol:prolipoprotein diacylglycerol transferase
MHPILFHAGPLTLYTYGLMLVVAFLIVAALASREAKALPVQRRPLSPEQAVDFTCAALLGGLIGGRLFYVGLFWKEFAAHPLDVLAIWHGGLVWYGGFLGGVAAGWCYVRAQRLPFLRVLDHVIPFGVLGHAIGRIGCFLNGCCYGKPTDAWCGVLFPQQPVPVLPTQLFEAGGLAVLFGVLLRLKRLPAVSNRPGRLLGIYLLSYAALRYAIEYLRGDQPLIWAGLTLQQLISLVMAAAGLILLNKAKVKRQK